jgi:hypothetical protein
MDTAAGATAAGATATAGAGAAATDGGAGVSAAAPGAGGDDDGLAAGWSTLAGGVETAVATGRNCNGSTYPSGTAANRTPRCRYGWATSGAPELPASATALPSETDPPSATVIDPRWVSVTA